MATVAFHLTVMFKIKNIKGAISYDEGINYNIFTIRTYSKGC